MKTTLTLKMRVSLYFSIFLLAGFSVLQGVAAAAVAMPEYDRLDPLTQGIERPTDVATDQQGNVYVAETKKNQVVILSQAGKLLSRVSVTEPLSVAVAADGKIFVGSKDGKVAVFGPELNFIANLGTFGYPTDIAIDSNGKVFVVDYANNTIKTFVNGSEAGAVGTPGAAGMKQADGQLWHPLSVAVDENAGEIVVLDLQQVYDSTSKGWQDGARIQYFDLAGNFLRAYSKYGKNGYTDWAQGGVWVTNLSMGQLQFPKQITVDAVSRLYVTEGWFNKVFVYDNFDSCLGTIDSTTSPLRGAIGLSMSDAGLLYVTNPRNGHQVEVFGVDQYTAMITTPDVVEFNVKINAPAPEAKTITIANQGKAEINWTSSSNDAWVSADATGTIAVAGNGTISVAVDPQGLAAGQYNGSVTIETAAGVTEVVKVVLTVDVNLIEVAGDLNFETTVGTTAAAKELQVTAGTPEPQLWDASADQAWIALSQGTGVTPATVKVYVDATGLEPGSFTGVVTFVSKTDSAVTVDVPLTLTLNAGDNNGGPGNTGGDGTNMWNKKWSVTQALPAGTALNGVSGSGRNNAVAVGQNGAMVQYDGKSWTQVASGTSKTLNSVLSTSDASSIAVGAEGTVVIANGTEVGATTVGTANLQDIADVDGAVYTAAQLGAILDGAFIATADCGMALRSITNGFAVGEPGSVCTFDGSNWTSAAAPVDQWLNGVWANSATEAFAVGENGAVVHFDGANWTAMDSGLTSNINGVCGFGGNDVYAAGDNGMIIRYDGSAWSAMDTGAGVNLNDIACIGKGDVIAVGDDGTVIFGTGGKFPWNKVILGIVNGVQAQKEEDKNK